MIRLQNLTTRQYLIILHDLLAAAAAVILTFYIRFEGAGFEQRIKGLLIFLPAFAVFVFAVNFIFGLHRNKWRFTSLPDLFNIVRVSTVLAVSLVALDYVLVAPNVLGDFFFGKITILLFWFLQMFFLAGPRVTYRYFRYTRTLQQARGEGANQAVIIGLAADAEVLLRAVESGAVHHLWPVGVLSPSVSDRSQAIRGVPVLGTPDDLEQVLAELESRGSKVSRVILTPSAMTPELRPESMLLRARRLGLAVSRMPSLEGGGEIARLAPVAVEDLLLRPSAQIDYQRLETFVRGKSVVVTGGGGSIGSEICDRVIAFGVARLLVIENSEPALHAVTEMLTARNSKAEIQSHIGDIRDRARMQFLLSGFKPDIVFHAAALKHVPILEADWGEAVKTNVFGTVNVADAAVAAGAAAMVMISTDKAIEPVSMLGATKRLAEMYCQALDHDLKNKSAGSRPAMRLMSVRFGNVLASNGSVVPKFKAQIDAGGPVTVTHPEMVRYFMTIREACDLVITSASHALGPQPGDVSVYVLNMGQPVKIVDLATNMIRLSGLEPGRDIQIVFTGMRPGERLNEILFAQEEPSSDIGISGIVAAKPVLPSQDAMKGWLAALERAVAQHDQSAIIAALSAAVPGYAANPADKTAG